MATHSVAHSTGVKTLSGSTVDTVTFSSLVGADASGDVLAVSNLDSTEGLSFTVDGTTNPTQGGEDAKYVPAGQTTHVSPVPTIYVVGSGNDYVAQVVK